LSQPCSYLGMFVCTLVINDQMNVWLVGNRLFNMTQKT
jgi:hypothetical protein